MQASEMVIRLVSTNYSFPVAEILWGCTNWASQKGIHVLYVVSHQLLQLGLENWKH